MSELGGSQITSLLETLPGIAHVLRSPVADAIVGAIRAGARIGEFKLAHAEELVRYATRRSLLGQEEGDRLLLEVQAAEQRRQDKAADRIKAQQARTKAPKAKPAPKAKAKRVKPVKPVKKVGKAKKR